MRGRIGLLIGILLTVLLTGTVMAQGPVTPQHSDPAWQATYWNNLMFSGPPALQRSEPNLNHDWGYGSPDPQVVADGFTARWIRYIDETPGLYRFTATSDDGIRVWLDGEVIINEWYDHAAKTVSVDRHLSAGHHLIVVDYYERAGLAVAKVSWAPVSGPGPTTGWRGEYFNNMSLSGAPAFVRDDANINFNWGTGSPAPGYVNGDVFSVRWTRTVNMAPGSYRFYMTVDDGARLWVNGHLLIDAWREQAATTYTGDIYLPGGAIPIKMEYFENTGLAVAQLTWTSAGGPGPGPAEVIVDDGGPGFERGGTATSWRTTGAGYGGRLTWTRNNDWARPNYNWARWYPTLAAGRYEVFVFIPDRNGTTAAARYWVAHANGFTQRVVNQSLYSNQWVSLGTYWFRGTRADYVSLADVTYEPYLSRQIAFDAVKWSPR